ncbi:hypothetical protein ASPACDRAFT_125849 [Aspergillus aculeatus ATCC 16872]|uniref:Rhodopsin domain-containing protein n=1 Tax=Aspergillus aculeatus (strain ATCC 16872 / CBS 172.66 / WB 5094) TaxID=690307 RepID=A0A1L9WJF0_ASPA1|nr:uncharacterized protein ASPACDRAFT_125849 [Aspergillus aculeatus ATCC 16872]OJJ96284.1 hypothetical protein ASPACDRAFT_125849 [Aspergillus aculeatus ATCC 16872]
MVIACRSIIVFLFAWYLAFQTTAIFQCTPIHHAWQKKTTQGRCVEFVPFVITLAATNLCTDLLLLALPTREIWKLQVAQGKKIGLSVIFTLGVMSAPPTLQQSRPCCSPWYPILMNAFVDQRLYYLGCTARESHCNQQRGHHV